MFKNKSNREGYKRISDEASKAKRPKTPSKKKNKSEEEFPETPEIQAPSPNYLQEITNQSGLEAKCSGAEGNVRDEFDLINFDDKDKENEELDKNEKTCLSTHEEDLIKAHLAAACTGVSKRDREVQAEDGRQGIQTFWKKLTLPRKSPRNSRTPTKIKALEELKSCPEEFLLEAEKKIEKPIDFLANDSPMQRMDKKTEESEVSPLLTREESNARGTPYRWEDFSSVNWRSLRSLCVSARQLIFDLELMSRRLEEVTVFLPLMQRLLADNEQLRSRLNPNEMDGSGDFNRTATTPSLYNLLCDECRLRYTILYGAYPLMFPKPLERLERRQQDKLWNTIYEVD